MTLSACARRLTLTLVPLCLLAMGRAALAAPTAASDAAGGEPKSHTLYLGADFSVEWDKEFYPIRAVSGGSFVIDAKGKLVKVPMNQGGSRLQLRQLLKLSETSATVGHLQFDRTYTAAHDPGRKLESMAAQIDYNNAQQDDLYRTSAVQRSYSSFLGAAGPNAANGDGGHGAAAQAALDSSVANSPQLDLAINNIGTHAANMENELAREQFDALELSFEVSSDRPLEDPYLIVVARHYAPGGKTGALRDWIHAEALDPIGSQPRKIHFKEGGFAPGFTLKEVQVHLFNRGEEIATSVAANRVQLTRSDAFRIMLLDYVGAHKGATLPAAPALGRLGREAKAQLGRAEREQVYYLRVAKDGLPTAIFADPSCSQPAPESIRTLIDPLRFYPALENGKAVESVVPVRLPSL